MAQLEHIEATEKRLWKSADTLRASTVPKKIASFKLNIPDLHSNLITEFNKYSENIYKQISILNIQNHKLAQARYLLLPKLMSVELTA